MGWGGATRCGSHFCVANPSHASWSHRWAAFAVFSLSPSSMSRASARHMVSTAHNVYFGSWLMKHIAIRSGTHVLPPRLCHTWLSPPSNPLCLSPCMHAHVGLNECFAHAKLNVRTCMIVGWNHTLAVLKIITALLCGLNISTVPKQALSPHQQTTLACVPHQKTSYDQHNTG